MIQVRRSEAEVPPTPRGHLRVPLAVTLGGYLVSVLLWPPDPRTARGVYRGYAARTIECGLMLLLPWRTVRDNIALLLEVSGQAWAEARIAELLERPVV